MNHLTDPCLHLFEYRYLILSVPSYSVLPFSSLTSSLGNFSRTLAPHLNIYSSIYHPSVCHPAHPSIHTSIYPPTHPSLIHISTHYPSIHHSSIYPPITHPSTNHPSIHPSPIHPSPIHPLCMHPSSIHYACIHLSCSPCHPPSCPLFWTVKRSIPAQEQVTFILPF